MKRERREFPIRLIDFTRRADAWGTEFGAAVFSEINVRLLSVGEGTLVPLSYAGLEHSDVSFQREAIVETLRKHRPRLLFVAMDLADPDLRENLEMALERRGEWLVCREAGGTLSVLGRRLTQEHASTLERAWALGAVVSSDLTDDLKLSTASSRLTWLWRAGLIERVEGTSAKGGREHRYFPIG